MCAFCDDPVPGEIPGDPDRVGDFGRAFLNTAEALRDAVRDLRAVANENITISLAIDEVREQAEQVIGDTSRVAVRYEGAGETFTEYSASLADARSMGNGARSQIIENNIDGRYWRHEERRLRDLVRWGNADPEILQDLQLATQRANYYDGQYSIHIGRYGVAAENFDRAVTRAVGGLITAMEQSGINDEWYEALAGDLQQLWELASKYLGPYIELLREIMEVLKQIVDVLALILTIASFIFPALGPLAAALGALSVLLSIAIFACSAILFLMGRETLGRVLSDGISMVTDVLLSRMGGGSLIDELADAGTGFTRFGMATRTTLLRAGNEVVPTLADYAAGKATEALIGGIVDANLAPIDYAIQSGMDFMIGTSTPWGEPAQGDLGEMFVSMANMPTLGLAGGVADTAGLFSAETYSGIGESWNEHFDTWGSIGAVPAT